MPSQAYNATYKPLECPKPLRERIDSVIPNLEGWTTPERCAEMALLVIRYSLRNYVEIGVFGGRSIISMAMAMEYNHTTLQNGSGRCYGIDPWMTQSALEGVQEKENVEWWGKLDIHGIHRGYMEAVWKNNLQHRIVTIRAEAQHCTRLFPKQTIDCLYIDGNHSEEASCRDVNLWKEKVEPGGFIIFDDADWPSTAKALEMLSSGTSLWKDGGKYRIYRKRMVHPNATARAVEEGKEFLSEVEDREWKKTHPASA